MALASSLHLTTLSLLMLVVVSGIGTIKSVSNALRTSSSATESVYQSVINANLTVLQVLVNLASKATIWLMELASSLHSTTLSLLMLVVVSGIGTIKSVSNALRTGSSILTTFVYQLTIFVHLTINLVSVPLVSLDIIFQMVIVSVAILCAGHQLHLDLVLHAILDM